MSEAWPAGFSGKIIKCPAERAKLRPKPFPAQTPPGFTVHRRVGNFQIVDARRDDQPVTGQSTVELSVDYTSQDLSNVGNDKRKLQLGVFLSGNWRIYSWNDLTDLNAGDPVSRPGTVTAQVTGDLSDPPVGWGSGGG